MYTKDYTISYQRDTCSEKIEKENEVCNEVLIGCLENVIIKFVEKWMKLEKNTPK